MSSGELFDPRGDDGDGIIDGNEFNDEFGAACQVAVESLGIAQADIVEAVESQLEAAIGDVNACSGEITQGVQDLISDARERLAGCPRELRVYIAGLLTQAGEWYRRCECDLGNRPEVCAGLDGDFSPGDQYVEGLASGSVSPSSVSPQTVAGIPPHSGDDSGTGGSEPPLRIPGDLDGDGILSAFECERIPGHRLDHNNECVDERGIPVGLTREDLNERRCNESGGPGTPIDWPADALGRDQAELRRLYCRQYGNACVPGNVVVDVGLGQGQELFVCIPPDRTDGNTRTPITPPQPPLPPPPPPTTSCMPCIRLCPESEPAPSPRPQPDDDSTPIIIGERPPQSSLTGSFAGGDCDINAYADLASARSNGLRLGTAQEWFSQFMTSGRSTELQFSDLLSVRLPDVVDFAAERLGANVGGLIDNFLGSMRPIWPCADPAYLTSQTMLAIAGLASKWVSGDVDQALWPVRYTAQRICPTQFPTAQEATQAFLGNAIGENTMATWATQNNMCWPPYERLVHAQRSKPSASDATKLYQRDQVGESEWREMMRNIGWTQTREQDAYRASTLPFPNIADTIRLWYREDISEEQFNAGMKRSGVETESMREIYKRVGRMIPPLETLLSLHRRKLLGREELDKSLKAIGLLDERERQHVAELSNQVPPIPDLVRFMVRDVEDDRIVTPFGLDDDFVEKYQGKVKEWTEAAGYNEDYMRRVWRAHWTIPSVSQLFTMFHRLSRLPEDDNRRVDLKTVETALQQQDIAPYWVPKLLAVSYRVLTRVDTRRAFEIGAINREEVKEIYQQQGYSPDNAERLVKFAERLRARKLPREKEAKAYAADAIAKQEAVRDLVAKGYNQDEIDETLLWIDRGKDFKANAICAQALKRRFLLFDIDEVDMRRELTQLNLTPEAIARRIKEAKCLRSARGRELTASAVCKMLGQRLITIQEALKRVQAIGYDQQSAILMVTSCQMDIDERERKRLEAQLKKEAAAAKRQQKEAEAARKKLEQQRKAAQRAREAAERKADQREKLLMQIARRVSDARDLTIETAFPMVNAERRRLSRDFAFSADDILRILDQASRQLKSQPDATYAELVDYFASEAEQA